jgi:hypothetical protein
MIIDNISKQSFISLMHNSQYPFYLRSSIKCLCGNDVLINFVSYETSKQVYKVKDCDKCTEIGYQC